MAKLIGQPFVVDNRPGAGGTIGSAAAATAAADGYTMLMSGVFNAIAPSLFSKMAYNYLEDFIHVAPTIYGPNVLVTRPDAPYSTLQELASAARAKPGAIAFASAGKATSGHLTMEMFQKAAGVQMVHVPYKGSAAAMQDVLAGQVPMIATNQDAVLPLVRSGKFKALAVTSAQRNPAFPTVPTFVESGFKDVVVTSWGALAVRRGTPAAVVERLRAAATKAMQVPSVREPLEATGWVVFDMKPDAFEAYVRDESRRWGDVIRAAGLGAS
jgi:tripartite-type tricarboxylate transporter receptor subunit TctC